METREKFEALPKIKKIMEDTDICYCDVSDCYTGLGALYATIGFMNGAWHAFQEQEKKLKELEEALTDVQYMCHKSISFEHDLFDKGWNQASRQTVINIHRLTGIGERLLNESKPQ